MKGTVAQVVEVEAEHGRRLYDAQAALLFTQRARPRAGDAAEVLECRGGGGSKAGRGGVAPVKGTSPPPGEDCQ